MRTPRLLLLLAVLPLCCAQAWGTKPQTANFHHYLKVDTAAVGVINGRCAPINDTTISTVWEVCTTSDEASTNVPEGYKLHLYGIGAVVTDTLGATEACKVTLQIGFTYDRTAAPDNQLQIEVGPESNTGTDAIGETVWKNKAGLDIPPGGWLRVRFANDAPGTCSQLKRAQFFVTGMMSRTD